MTRKTHSVGALIKTALLAPVWLVASIVSSCEELPGQNVAIATPVLRHWALQYREFSTEFLDCVFGHRSADTLYIDVAIPADVRPSRSTPDDVTPASGCPVVEHYVGDVHSHPHETAALNGQRFHIDPNADLCYLSHADQQSFRDDSMAKLTIVVCGFGQLMLWLREDSLDHSGKRCYYDAEFPNGCKTLPDPGKSLSAGGR